MASPLYDVPFNELPNPRQVWVGEPGSEEEGMGKLSLLTPERVAAAAAREIKTGKRVTLQWDMSKLEIVALGRSTAQHHILPLLGGMCFDDVYIFNPQVSSQWDGLRHCSQGVPGQEQRMFYGGTTAAEIQDRSNNRIGMQFWAQKGIAGRGILIDYASYADKKGIKFNSFTPHEVKLSEIQDIIKECNITIQKGDLLFMRVGITRDWDTKMSISEKTDYANKPTPELAGVEPTVDMLRWIWDSGFAAVAGDSIAFEVWPPRNPEVMLHEYLLAGWGMPIGELFDLEALAEMCKELNRWSFFLSSVPLNQKGGVSSPPSAMAIF
ncbi:hypothetical protein EYZ11_006611 [Aspergillus tanneri]|uniref:Cyclase n=1 Tax=Aspergillus tanneri TaxID=1220188 RepID=A0A4S3JEZ7_9EURO|nr:uncharacterized protein ATNIH1004_002225 [Aspergillus tanneri]KAA8649554.1 hypothetical protein ATNIH1004_002225 [Aspergillus tanneri]THC93893.1 hypothetical protein EYZ11_006611 [Aspergillus tanneri]